MAHFQWTDDLMTGNFFIDNDHRKLIRMVNAFFDSMAEGRANAVIGKVLHNLTLYAKQHFGREEAEMKRIRYADADLHRAEHAVFVKQVEALKSSLNAGEKINVLKVSTLLSDWLRNHILVVDKQLAAALKVQAQTA